MLGLALMTMGVAPAGQASGWFFQYPGVPVPGFGAADVTNPKSIEKRFAVASVVVTTLYPAPSTTPDVLTCNPVGTTTPTVYVPGGKGPNAYVPSRFVSIGPPTTVPPLSTKI